MAKTKISSAILNAIKKEVARAAKERVTKENPVRFSNNTYSTQGYSRSDSYSKGSKPKKSLTRKRRF